ncbi:ferritin-like domain-containing protein [Sphingomonas sp. S2-65]|uniref:ferritin-like domain-containing protein n=1 Tax=Sphingomonas sp. S2-65 TaxID=2903960 RepID=UPI001F451E90|nr:ferritin-like domain-containing protein [Sphingomonas sp. S2-65]UYY58931.1 ferritin-like domain-containing protein [Sphingomonas sp. S2-65]
MQNTQINDILAACEERRAHRRQFMKMAGGVSAAVAGASLLAGCDDDDDDGDMVTPTPSPSPTPTPSAVTSDQNILNFALNLEYLEAQFYAFAVNGAYLPANLLSGTGAAGAATGAKQVTFTDPMIRAFAREIAADEVAHVTFLRGQLGSVAVAQPALDLRPEGPFTTAARAAGLVGATGTFDPYASENNFLLAAFLFEDVGVTAYRGSAALLESKLYLEAAAGIMATEGYHAAMVRTALFRRGVATPSLIDSTEAISNARDSLDGNTDLDQGIRPINGVANIVPTDANALAFGRSAGQVLNIVYLTPTATNKGGFFPNGVNGTLSLSAANA